MESYCLKCKKHTKNINPQVSSTSNGKLMILSKCARCGSKKSKFINTQEESGLLSKLGLKTPLSKIPVLGDTLFLFTKNKERIQKLKKTRDTSYIYKNELDKSCFQHDMAYGDFKDLVKRTAAAKALRNKAFKIASDQKCDGYQRGLASMVYTFFDKKPQGKGLANNKGNVQLADELHQPIIRKFKKRKVYSSFRDNIWGVDFADMQLLSKCNKGFRFLLCAIDIFSKYAWVIPLQDKKDISIVNAFKQTLREFNCKPNKIWVDKESEFCNNSFKKW